jgi:hypothetical protein
MHFPPNPDFTKLKLFIDASYPSNCAEPYAFSEFSFHGNTISIGVLDWQDDVDDVIIECTSIGASGDITLDCSASTGRWSARLAELPGLNLLVTEAKFLGTLNNPAEISPAPIKARVPALNPSALICTIRAKSGGGSLWGFIQLSVVDAPQ